MRGVGGDEGRNSVWAAAGRGDWQTVDRVMLVCKYSLYVHTFGI